ncbi:hypothetical protein [uncultured Marinobacter sp.]|uniref:hypothetical protein n=1 Tax=uncultured Marinobacter sp. TaxID=187379 RepID=UPI00258EA51E|nr:hypothetical protein [uncultured Marinobacter sp.]
MNTRSLLWGMLLTGIVLGAAPGALWAAAPELPEGLGDDPHQRDLSIAETRLQLEAEKYFKGVTLRLTGDLVFINDLFPKDWVSFFIGRDVEYLKAPSDALKVSAFSSWANLDLVYTPRFDADRFIDGRRLSFFNTGQGRLTGRNAVVLAGRCPRN